MALKNIFEMIKADRYTADGREVLNKAREAEVEDRTYQIGEISQKTGLQKTANGWVKPKNRVIKPTSKNQNIAAENTKLMDRRDELISKSQKQKLSAEESNEMKTLTESIAKNFAEMQKNNGLDEAPRVLTGDTKIRVRKA